MATVRIKGGPELKARLASIIAGSPELVKAWADDAKERIARDAPNARRPASRQWSTRAQGNRAGVYGAFWWVFVDRGTKAHDILPRRAKVLRWDRGGRTVFAKRVHQRGLRRRPFITRNAQAAFASSKLSEQVVKLWNRRRLTSRSAFL